MSLPQIYTPCPLTDLNRFSHEELKEQVVLWHTAFIRLVKKADEEISPNRYPVQYPGDRACLEEWLWEKEGCLIRTRDDCQEVLDAFWDKFCD